MLIFIYLNDFKKMFTELVPIIVIILWYLDGKKKTQDSKTTKYLQKIEHTGTKI